MTLSPTAGVETEIPGLRLRRFREGDATSLAREADDPRIAANLRDRFPSPYTLADAQGWIAHRSTTSDANALAITFDDVVIGGIGVMPGEDVHRFEGEVGYWLGVDYWGKGFATAALRAFTDHVFIETALERLTGLVFSSNPASGRVLEKCGYTLESVARRSVFKNGELLDGLIYVRLRD